MIESISLKDFKCFHEKTTFPISRINVLYGMNGRGKSSLLQSLLLLAQSLSETKSINKLSLSGNLVNLGQFADVLNRNSSSSGFTIGIKDGNEEMNATYGQDANPILASLVDLTVGEHSFFDESSSSSSFDDTKLSMGVIDKSNVRLLNSLEHIRYVSAERLGPREFMERKPVAVDMLGVNGEYAFQVIEGQGSAFLKDTTDMLNFVLGGASVRVDTSADRSIIQLYLDSFNGSQGFKPINVGFGYSYVLPVVLAMLLSKSGDILILENPEAHLHPAAQSRLSAKMVALAKEKGVQLFIETHSDHIINGLRIAVKNNSIGCNDVGILHFARKSEVESSPILEIRVDKEGNLSSLPDDFMDEWNNQLLQLV